MIPDKIYIQENDPSMRYGVNQDSNIKGMHEYINKDVLLKWAKELKGQVCSLHPNNRDATCARDGMLTIIDNIFDKLNNF